MLILSLVCGTVLYCQSPQPLPADSTPSGGLIRSLPKPGQWVKYVVSGERNLPHVASGPVKGQLILRSLGKVVEDKNVYFSIGVDLRIDGDNENEVNESYRLLYDLPSPSDAPPKTLELLRVFIKRKKEDSYREVEVKRQDEMYFWLFYDPPRLMTLEPRLIVTTDGEKQCSGLAGFQELGTETEQRKADQSEIGTLTREIWQHESVASGVFQMVLRLRISDKNRHSEQELIRLRLDYLESGEK